MPPNPHDLQVETTLLDADGPFPNNGDLPVLLYRDAFSAPAENLASAIERTFRANGWRGTWRNGIYGYHHYHSTAHEVLGIARGSASIQLGGPHGETFDVRQRDVIVLPAGIPHKKLKSSSDFLVVGAYPEGQSWDMNYGKPGERPDADANITQVPLPQRDPVQGTKGPLLMHWTS